MSQGNPSSGNQDANGVMMVIICIASVFLFAVILWMRFHVTISSLFIFTRNLWNWPLYQLYVLLVKVSGGDIQILRLLLSSTTQLCAPTSTVNIFTTCTTNVEKITFSQISFASLFWNVIFGLISLVIAFIGYFRISEQHPNVKFGKKHSLDSFMQEQKQNHAHLKVFTDFNLQMVNQNKGPLMGMKTTREFAMENGLVDSETEREIQYISNGVTKSQKDSLEKVPTVDRTKLIRILRNQLGGLWVGVDHITEAEAILLAMYLPRACSIDREMLDSRFKQIFESCIKLEEEFWEIAENDILYSDKFAPIGHESDGSPIYPDGKKDLSPYKIDVLKEKYIKPFMNEKITQELLSKHAYTRTFIIDVIFHARKLGVMAPCQLRWLKFYDREMWALLQNIGRPSFFCENMGAISHYQAEMVAEKKIYQPHFDVAIRGFEFQLQSYQYSPALLKNMGSNPKKNEIADDEHEDRDL